MSTGVEGWKSSRSVWIELLVNGGWNSPEFAPTLLVYIYTAYHATLPVSIRFDWAEKDLVRTT